MASLSPSTYNRLGLGLAASFTTIGLACIAAPTLMASKIGFGSLNENASDEVRPVLGFIGARDLSFGVSIFALSRAGRFAEMGTVLLSTVVFSVWDVSVLWAKGLRAE